MTLKTPSIRNLRNPLGCLVLLAALAAAAGCSTAETPSGSGNNMNHVLPSGQSVSGWLVTPSGGDHKGSATQDYIAGNGSSNCGQCHGSDLSGGISNVSCFGNPAGCHHDPVAGWVATPPGAQQHGNSAKASTSSGGSFYACQICHGSNFSGGGSTVSCFICHGVSAPHPRRPWRTGAGSLYDHGNTDPSNASVCYTCHAYTGTANPNNPHPPSSPAPPGTAPGCFNGTMCHNQAGHPAGWTAVPPAPQPHGDSAKAANGFPSCQPCHGNNFAGGTVNVSCFICHGVSAPHAPKPWRGTPYTHTTTVEAGNAPVCYTCHAYTGTTNPNNPHPPSSPAPPGTAPGCFNGTMCHNEAGHPAGWVATPPAAQPHGNTAKQDGTVPGQGFPSCQTCHGSNFAGGPVNVSCLNNASCHGAGVASPHAPKPWRGSPYTHSTTVGAGNAPVCYTCHAYTGTANPNNPHPPPSPAPPGTAPGCFNGTMCHNQPVGHAKPYNDPSHYAVTAGTFPGSCGACHTISGSPVNPPAPNPCRTCHVAGDPTTSTNCSSCHGNAAATPPSVGSPTGTVYPNNAGTSGSHATHIALNSAGSPISCDTCHNGLGPSLANLEHYNRANAVPTENAARVPPGDVLFLATYDAKTGASAFDNGAALSCSNVSCHGGQATPSWQNETLDVNNGCTSCHQLGPSVGNPQYNSEYSGRHQLHLSRFPNNPTTCKYCHNTAALAVNHFTTLADNTMSPAVASATIGGTGTLINVWTPGSGTTGSCSPGCHGTENW